MQLADFQELHRESISDSDEIERILRRVARRRVELNNGMDHKNRLRRAWIVDLTKSGVVLRHENIDHRRQLVLPFSFELDGGAYSVGGVPKAASADGQSIEIEWPTRIHINERRTRLRSSAISSDAVTLFPSQEPAAEVEGLVFDRSKDGLGLLVDGLDHLEVGSLLSINYHTGEKAGHLDSGELRYREADSGSGWRRVGLLLNPTPKNDAVEFERRSKIFPGGVRARGWNRIAVGQQTMRMVSRIAVSRLGIERKWTGKIRTVEFLNSRNQTVRGIVDRVGSTRGGVAVVIPPAWGRTKETLLPLARTLVETFEAAGQAATILRYDGTQRRGESYIDRECRVPGDETLNFTYSQAADDLASAARFLRSDQEISASKVGLVTFSLAAIEGRIALAADDEGLVNGWVSVVGMSDVQSALKAVSGGIDYIFGKEAGVDFGIHELGGVRIDIDHAAVDVMSSDLATLDEAKRDMTKIDLPITWIHGRYDGWTSIDRARDLLTAGSRARRKLIEVPTGHQLRNSSEALDTFQLVAQELSAMLLGRPLAPRVPDLNELDLRGRQERSRIGDSGIDVRAFWQDYLLGRDGSLGMQLLGATDSYASFMTDQIVSLRLATGMRVLDLGSGTGEFSCHLAKLADGPRGLTIDSMDFVVGALRRARDRAPLTADTRYGYCSADFEQALPFRGEAFDRILSSLVVSYLTEAKSFMKEMYRLLKPGGVLVISCPRRDADLSTVYRATMEELTPEDVADMVGARDHRSFDDLQRSYLNEAARLVALEESGRFQFRDEDELRELVNEAGFCDVESKLSLGYPPQTAIVAATKPL